MKIKLTAIISLLLLLMLLLCACGEVTPPVDDNNNDDTELSDDTNKTDDENAQDQVAKKPIKNILILGDSFGFYFVEELCAIAAANGYDINVCNLYYSGCRLGEHWKFYSNNEEVYSFYHTTKDERVKTSVTTFQGALDYAKETLGGDWDVITLHETVFCLSMNELSIAKAGAVNHAANLYDLAKGSAPDATLYWQQTWAFSIGWKSVDGNTTLSSVGQQLAQHEVSKSIANWIRYDLDRDVDIIPSGNAWKIARTNLNDQDLCESTSATGKVSSDFYHDGTTGGGQYLNGCVWFEVLFGESCVGNTWRPDYELSEEKIAVLQEAAHKAVADMYGKDYAK